MSGVPFEEVAAFWFFVEPTVDFTHCGFKECPEELFDKRMLRSSLWFAVLKGARSFLIREKGTNDEIEESGPSNCKID